MKTSYIVGVIVVVVVLAVLGFIFFGNQSSTQTSHPAPQTPAPAPPTATPPPASGQTAPSSATVTYTDSGFSPATITIKKGGTVTFKNNASDAMWVGSNPHPIHTGYPTTGGCIGSTFDSCKGIPPGGSWSFTFNVIGSWGYHNHLNPGEGGTVVVQ